MLVSLQNGWKKVFSFHTWKLGHEKRSNDKIYESRALSHLHLCTHTDVNSTGFFVIKLWCAHNDRTRWKKQKQWKMWNWVHKSTSQFSCVGVSTFSIPRAIHNGSVEKYFRRDCDHGSYIFYKLSFIYVPWTWMWQTTKKWKTFFAWMKCVCTKPFTNCGSSLKLSPHISS